MFTKKNYLKIALLFVLIITVVLGFIFFDPNAINNEQNVYAEELSSLNNESTFSDDKVIVVLTKSATREFKNCNADDFKEINAIAVNDLTANVVDWVKKKVLGIPTQKEMLINVDKFRRILSIQLSENSKENVLNAIKVLQQRPDVETASPNYIFKINAVANDSNRSSQWALNNINMNSAWNITTGSKDVLVGILDTGIDASHADLTNNIYRKTPHTIDNTLHRDFTTGIDGGEPVLEPVDTNGHGTHVAGIIGAEGNNSMGCSGVAWNTSLVSLKVLDQNNNGGLENITAAIYYATSCNIPILNFSGGAYDNVTLIDEINKLQNVVSAYEGLLVVSAGNDEVDIDTTNVYPASYSNENIITVGAIDNNNQCADFRNLQNLWGLLGGPGSNYGLQSVDLFAPGKDILSTYPGNNYVEMSGTSMATPFVTGVAALILSEYPELTATQIKEMILNNVDRVSGLLDKCLTGGRLNAYKALNNYFKTGNNGTEIIGLSFTPVGEVDIPSKINGITITSIGSGAFYVCKQLTDVYIPATVTSIGSYAFQSCSSLQSVTFEQNSQLTNIGEMAFYACNNLRSFIFPQITNIGNAAFYGCGKITSLIIPASVTDIGGEAFASCSSLQSVTFSANCQLTAIKAQTFAFCRRLASITIPSTVTTINGAAFYECSNLQNVTFASTNTVTNISDQVFYNCSSLKNIVIPSSVTRVGEDAFYGSGIYNDTANNSVVYADDWCVGYKGVLTEIDLLEDTIGIADYAFDGCNTLVNVVVPNDVNNLGSYAFANCGNLNSVALGSSVNTINQYAFLNDSNLQSVTLSSNVTTIGGFAFTTYGNLTIYAENTQALSGWESNWNASSKLTSGTVYQYNPVVWGCTLSNDNTYVVSFTKTSSNISNPSSITLSEPSRAGYIFKGWYSNSTYTGTSYTAAQLSSAPNQTYYAKWGIDDSGQLYAVTFNANGGTSCESITVEAGETITLPYSTKAGHAGTWGEYDFGASYTVTENTTLTATWTAKTYTITFNKNGGSGGTSSAQVTYGSTFPQITTPERSGYRFGNYRASSGYSYYTNGTETDKYYIDGDLTLTAYWVEAYLDIEIVSKSGSNWSIKITNNSSKSVTVYYNEKMCFENDAKTWTGLNNVNDDYILAPGASQTVTISENWFATHIAVSYTCPEGRRITYACDLNSSTKTMTITKITI